MNIVDASCLICGDNMKWLSGTRRWHPECRNKPLTSDPPEARNALSRQEKQRETLEMGVTKR